MACGADRGVQTFLHAWWADSLSAPDATVPAYEVLAFCAEASRILSPWLAIWEEMLTQPLADMRLAEAVEHWELDLLEDQLPWDTRYYGDEEALRVELAGWVIRHAPARLRACGASEQLLHSVRLLSVTGLARFDDPHWPYPAR